MDGGGSIQINHWRKKYLQYRLVIKLKNTIYNKHMLDLISLYLGGSVRLIKNSFIIWFVNNKKKLNFYIEIFEKYKPLTFRLSSQLYFLKICLRKNDIFWYLSNRDKKYLFLKKNMYNNIYPLSYFPE